jgi:hypothetical protein
MIGDKGRKKIEDDNSSTRMKNDLKKKKKNCFNRGL